MVAHIPLVGSHLSEQMKHFLTMAEDANPMLAGRLTPTYYAHCGNAVRVDNDSAFEDVATRMDINLEPKLHTWVFRLKGRDLSRTATAKATSTGGNVAVDDDEDLDAPPEGVDGGVPTLGLYSNERPAGVAAPKYEVEEADTVQSLGGLVNVGIAKNKFLRNWKKAQTWGPGHDKAGHESLEGIPLILVTRRRRTRYVAKTDKDGVATFRLPTDDYILTAGMIPIRASNEDDDPAMAVSECDVNLYTARKVAMRYFERAHHRLQEAIRRTVRRRRLAKHIDFCIVKINIQMHRWLKRTRLRKQKTIVLQGGVRGMFGRRKVRHLQRAAVPIQTLVRRVQYARVATDIKRGAEDAFPRWCAHVGKRATQRAFKRALKIIYDAEMAEKARLQAIQDAKDAELEAEREKIREMQRVIEANRAKKREQEYVARAAAEKHRELVRRKTNAVVKLGRFFRAGFGTKKK